MAVAIALVAVLLGRSFAARRRRYETYMAAIRNDPTDWLAILTGRPAPRSPTGPVVQHLGLTAQSSALVDDKVLAFDTAHIVLRSLGRRERCTTVDRNSTPPSYRSKTWHADPLLRIGPHRLIGIDAPTIAGQLAYLGWHLPHAAPHPPPGALWRSPGRPARPAPRRATRRTPVRRATSRAATPRRTGPPRPVAPARPVTHEIEYGGDSLGPAIDDWLDADVLDDIE